MKAAVLIIPVTCCFLLMHSCRLQASPVTTITPNQHQIWGTKEVPEIPYAEEAYETYEPEYVEPEPVEEPEEIIYWAVDRMGDYYTDEQLEILREECEENCSEYPQLWPIIAAIGRAENGATHAFGILHPKANTWRKQAGWCAATVRKNYDRWLNIKPENAVGMEAFIIFLGNRYCPVNADNDPTGLNKHWIKNVTWYMKYYVK